MLVQLLEILKRRDTVSIQNEGLLSTDIAVIMGLVASSA